MAKELAQETSSWYISHQDPYASHSSNIRNFLRGPVLALTLRMLLAPEHQLEMEQAPHEDSDPNSWTSYLANVAIEQWTKHDQDAYDNLERRARARMDGFIAGCALAVPNDFDEVPGEAPRSTKNLLPNGTAAQQKDASMDAGLAGFKSNMYGSPILRNISAAHSLRRITSTGASTNQTRCPQFHHYELATRLELYIRCLKLVRSIGKEVIVDLESPKAIKSRANAVVRSFVATVGCVRSMRPCLTLLLQCLTRELLAVDSLCNEISNVIRRLVSEYEHQTSFASLAFLSSPEDSAANRLTPLVTSYLQYLRSNWEMIVEGCEIERMLSKVLQPEMRHLFKTIDFKSIGHLLEVCHGFHKELQSIELPPGVGGISGQNVDSVCSNSKAIQQAIRDLQREVITVNGHILPPANSRKELLQLLSQMLNSRSLLTTSNGRHKSKKNCLTLSRKSVSCPSLIINDTKQNQELDSEGFISSGNEGDTDDGNTYIRRPVEVSHRNRRRSFHVSMVDLMTRRLLIASSRTGMGGDAFFIVRDLFGGDDVEVVPSRAATAHGQPRVGTIEIVVRLASVTIKCHGSLDVYPKSRIGDCEPLIQLHTTTAEIISLQEVRASDSERGEGKIDAYSSEEDGNDEGSKMVLQEKKNDRTGWRTLSISPALYEAVEKWTTPS